MNHNVLIGGGACGVAVYDGLFHPIGLSDKLDSLTIHRFEEHGQFDKGFVFGANRPGHILNTQVDLMEFFRRGHVVLPGGLSNLQSVQGFCKCFAQPLICSFAITGILEAFGLSDSEIFKFSAEGRENAASTAGMSIIGLDLKGVLIKSIDWKRRYSNLRGEDGLCSRHHFISFNPGILLFRPVGKQRPSNWLWCPCFPLRPIRRFLRDYFNRRKKPYVADPTFYKPIPNDDADFTIKLKTRGCIHPPGISSTFKLTILPH